MQIAKPSGRYLFLFSLLWSLLFVLYFPAAKAGFVTDFTGWLQQVRQDSLWDFVNRTHFHSKSLYQFTQLCTYIFYHLFGTNAWLWHCLHITLQALNACLLFRLCKGLLEDVGVESAEGISLAGTLLFCVSPYLSEVIVWEPSFHYLLGLFFILTILGRVQRYFHHQDKKYAWQVAALFFVSTFSIEIFYITPFLTIALILFYAYGVDGNRNMITKGFSLFLLPQILLFVFYLLLYRGIYDASVAHIGNNTVAGISITYFGKPAKYLFHIFFLGRFYPDDLRRHVYVFCDTVTGIILFWAVVAAAFVFTAFRFRKMGGRGKATSLLFCCTIISLCILVPLWFPDSMLVVFDRYIYFADAFAYIFIAVVVSYIPSRYAAIAVVALYALVNIRFTIKVNRFWGKSAKVISGMLNSFPKTSHKTVILLNLPEMLKGTPMIGSSPTSEFKLMYNLLMPDSISNKVYDVVSYNTLTPDDGAHVNVLNDSTIRVTLNQWGTWWWYDGLGATSYENEDYKMNMIDDGHFYELTLKKPATNYLLLYQVGDRWKIADWNKKVADQN